MRTDYKIGVAVILFVVGGIVLYCVLSTESSPHNATQEETDPPDSRLASSELSGGGFYSQPGRQDEGVTAGLGGSLVGRDNSGDNASEYPSARQGAGNPTGASGGDTGSNDASPRHTPAAGQTAGPSPGSGSGGTAPSVSGESRQATGTGWPSGPDTYVVREGDAGFWAVAQNAYGHGKHWHLVAQANPSADSNALRAGQKLKIPPLPRPSQRAGRNTTLAGSIVTEGSGIKYYYVRPGDAGFWAVSEQAYRDGKHWAIIKNANPQADSGRLRAGQKLIIPPLPAAGALPHAAGTAAASGASPLRPGEKWYTIQEGDNGFWDVAKKNYGSGKHWKLIADANPDVDATRLRAGRKLRVPPRPAQAAATAAGTAGRPRVADSDVSRF